MRLGVPGPRDVLRLGEQGWSALEQAVALVPRLAAVLDEVELITARATQVVEAVDATRARADAVVARTERVVEQAGGLVEGAEKLTARAGDLLDAYEPPLTALHPTLVTLSETTSPQEVEAMVAMVDLLPQLVENLETDIMPILHTMGTVAPDLRDLLDVSRELNELIGALPGLGRVKKRIEEQQEREDEERRSAQQSTREPVERPPGD